MMCVGTNRPEEDAGAWERRLARELVAAIASQGLRGFARGQKSGSESLQRSDRMRAYHRDLGDLKEFLRMRITRIGSSIVLNQRAYLDKVPEHCSQKDTKLAKTPLPEGYMLVPHEGAVDLARRRHFQVVIGLLLYLMLGTRPDIAFVVTKLALYSANPSKNHLNRALYICRYLQGTCNYMLEYNGASGLGLVAYTNADWGTDSKHHS